MSVETTIAEIAKSARIASREVAKCPTAKKDEVLLKIADEIINQAKYIKKENKTDLSSAKKAGLSGAFIDRLTISDSTIKLMSDGLKEVAALEDPVGSISRTWIRPNGLQVSRMRIPLGVIGIIYESRPNVTVDAAGLCLKAGNAVILRGGSEALNSNHILVKIVSEAAYKNGLPEGSIQFIETTDREMITIMIKLDSLIDLI